MKFKFFIFIFCLLACSNKKKKEILSRPIANNTFSVDSTLIQHDSNDTILVPEIENISFDIEKLKKINFGIDSLSDSLVLYSLFGSFEASEPYLLDLEEDFVSVWHSTTTKPKFYIDYNEFYEEGEPLPQDTLPYKDKNCTFITQKKYFQNKDKEEFCLVSFSTSDDYPPTGRYSSGLLSLALFKKDKFWRLDIFNLMVNFQGSFSTASTFDTIIGNYIVINGGKANPEMWQVVDSEYVPRYSNLYYIDINTLEEKVCFKNSNCGSIYKTKGSVWGSTVELLDNKNFKILTEGEIDKKNYWGGAPITIDSIQWNKLPRKFEFKSESEYSTEGKYIPQNGKLKIFKGKKVYF